jgi:hypothetical protein
VRLSCAILAFPDLFAAGFQGAVRLVLDSRWWGWTALERQLRYSLFVYLLSENYGDISVRGNVVLAGAC